MTPDDFRSHVSPLSNLANWLRQRNQHLSAGFVDDAVAALHAAAADAEWLARAHDLLEAALSDQVVPALAIRAWLPPETTREGEFQP